MVPCCSCCRRALCSGTRPHGFPSPSLALSVLRLTCTADVDCGAPSAAEDSPTVGANFWLGIQAVHPFGFSSLGACVFPCSLMFTEQW